MTPSQPDFIAALLDPALPAPQGLTNGAGKAAGKRYDVYRNNVAASLTEALIAAFPVIHKLVGDAFFRAMAGVYLRKHLPTSPLMMYYGQKMPHFLMRFGPAQGLAYLPDIARLELAMRESYHAADADPISADRLAQCAPDALMGSRVTLAPSLRLIRSSHPIHGIYRANTRTDAPKPVQRAENVLITRPDFDPVQTPISDAAADLITALQAGDPLGVAMTQAGPKLDLGAVLGLLLRQKAMIELNGKAPCDVVTL